MNRRDYLKRLGLLSGSVALPIGVFSMVGRHLSTTEHGLPGFSGRIMGTGYSVFLGADSTGSTGFSNDVLEHVAAVAHDALKAVDDRMSTWLSRSEISQINRADHTDWISVSSDTFKVIESALATSALSDGAFDATVGPIVDLWGFGAGSQITERDQARVPSVQAISQMLTRVGYRLIDLHPTQSAIRKRHANTQLDLSGIAKGYAVDQLAHAMANIGYSNYLVELGGELRSSGAKPDGSYWKVAIETPNRFSDAYRVFELRSQAVATSGDYRHFFNHGNKRYSHSIDPRSGYPTSHSLASVTVVSANAMQADSLSTALMIMGLDDAMLFCEKHSVAAHFIVRSRADQLTEKFSQAFLTNCSDCV